MRALAVLAALTMTLVVAAPVQAAEARVWAFVYANQLQAQGTYMPVQAATSGVIAMVSRPSNDSSANTGRYRVSLTNMGAPGAAGVPIVTAVSNTGTHCQVAAFVLSGATETVDVDCYTGTTRADSKFMFTFFSSTPPDTQPANGAYGYVFNNQPTLGTNTNPPRYNSTGGDVHIYRAGSGDTGTGQRWDVWTARFFGEKFRNNAGNVQVTAVGTVPARCVVFQWYQHSLGADAQVRCDRAATANPPQWTLVYAHDRSIVGGTTGFFGYLQANDPTSPAYTPSPPRNRAPDGYAHTVTRSGPGRYQVQVYGPLKAPVSLQLSANGHTDNFCNLNSWTVDPNVQPAGLVNLTCYDRNGVPADSWYSLNYYSPA